MGHSKIVYSSFTHICISLVCKMGSKNGKPVLREEDIMALTKSSGLEEAQVKEFFDKFIVDYPNGKLKVKDFRETMLKALPKKDANKMDKHVFRMYDNDSDGLIDFTEFMLVFHIMSDSSPEEVLVKIFRVFDVDSDGTISKKEMKKLIKDMYGLLKTDDPSISAEKMIAKTAFAEMDENQDGTISQEELVRACMGQQEISKLLALKVIDIFVGGEE